MELKLEVWDSPNSAGVVIDAVRCVKLALDNGISGALEAPSSYFMKSPPVQFTDDMARDNTEDFIRRYSHNEKTTHVAEPLLTVAPDEIAETEELAKAGHAGHANGTNGTKK